MQTVNDKSSSSTSVWMCYNSVILPTKFSSHPNKTEFCHVICSLDLRDAQRDEYSDARIQNIIDNIKGGNLKYCLYFSFISKFFIKHNIFNRQIYWLNSVFTFFMGQLFSAILNHMPTCSFER